MQQGVVLQVQKYMRSGKTLADPKVEHGIKIKEYDRFVCLNYDQIKSKKTHPITVECRSLKLLKDDDWTVVSRSFDRFYNYGESPDEYAAFDFQHAVALEKVDGSLISFWWNPLDKQWEMSTRANIFAEGGAPRQGAAKSEKGAEASFCDVVTALFPEWRTTFSALAADFADLTEWTVICEWCAPQNLVVTPYEKSELVLLGMRHNLSGRYKTMAELATFHQAVLAHQKEGKDVPFRLVRTFPLASFAQVQEACRNFTRLEEGFVVWDTKNDLRVKVTENGSTPERRSAHSNGLGFIGEKSAVRRHAPLAWRGSR